MSFSNHFMSVRYLGALGVLMFNNSQGNLVLQSYNDNNWDKLSPQNLSELTPY